MRDRHHRPLFTLPVLALLASGAGVDAQVTLQDPPWKGRLDSLEAAVPRWMDEAAIPGLALAVVTSREAWTRDFGVISVDGGRPVGPGTLFEGASLSKPVFAHLVLDAAADGLIALDTPLDSYWRYPDLDGDPRRAAITPRMVLSHRTGLPNWRRDEPLSVGFEPGSRFQYSGEGYVYLQRVLAELLATDLHRHADQGLFRDLGMTRSSFTFDTTDPDHALPHHVEGHALEKRPAPSPGNAAASLHTTAREYGAFVAATLGLARRDPQRFGEVTERAAEVADGVGWGLGWGLEYPGGRERPALWHWGDNGPFKAFVYVDPVADVGFVFFANSANGLTLITRFLEHLFPGPHPLMDWLDYRQLPPVNP